MEQTRVVFRVDDKHDHDGVLTHFVASVVVVQGDWPIAIGELGRFNQREDAERIAREAWEKASNVGVELVF